MAPVEIKHDYYAILEASPAATDVLIKANYRRLALLRHPDKNGGSAKATAEFQLLNQAYQTLKDEILRRNYDYRWLMIVRGAKLARDKARRETKAAKPRETEGDATTPRDAKTKTKPAEEKTKPAEKRAKPAEEKPKPAEERPKPAKENARRAQEKAKPTDVRAHPAEKKAKPAKENAKAAKAARVAKAAEAAEAKLERAATAAREAAQKRWELSAAKCQQMVYRCENCQRIHRRFLSQCMGCKIWICEDCRVILTPGDVAGSQQEDRTGIGAAVETLCE